MRETRRTATNPARETGAEAFALLGAPSLAFIGPVETDGGRAFGIHAANGKLLAVMPSRDLAFAAARRNDLEPVDVH